jgi:hypothetical protein
MFTKDLLKRKKKKKLKAATNAEPVAEPEPEPEPRVADAPVQPSEMPPIMTPDGELVGYNVLIADDPPKPKARVKAEVAEEDEPAPAPAPAPKPRPARKAAKTDHPSDRARTWTEEDDEETTPYEMKPPEVKDEERIPEAVLKPTAEDMALLDRRDAVKPPKHVWTAEVFAFLLQPGTVSALIVLTGAATLAGVAVRVARMFNPVAGSD